jgi:transposase InsO family protein
LGGRGRRHEQEERQEALELIDEAVKDGSRQAEAAETLNIDPRTVQRWRAQDGGEDRRAGPLSAPANKLTVVEREQVLEVVNSPEYRDLPPTQIVPRLADEGVYVASEATIYRILREEGQAGRRGRARSPAPKPKEHVSTGPNQVWSWDITYLRSALRGQFFYLYLIVDIWSRKVVGWAVHQEESMDHAAALIAAAATAEGIEVGDLVLHSDNGGPMKGSTMLATLQALGIAASFSRPSVSNDNPYSESLFKTLKYRPEYPTRPFEDTSQAAAWVAAFVDWYNTEHRHSAIRMVTPAQRHVGTDIAVLEARDRLYKAARHAHPNRWSGSTRDWSQPGLVVLNPGRSPSTKKTAWKAA